MNNVDSAVDLDVLIKFSLRILIIFAVIFVLAILTPKLAKLVDGWIRKYRQDHPKKETYGLRSIYELPPAPEDAEDGEYDLEEDYGEPDEDDYLLDEEAPPVTETLTEPIWLFSFDKIDVEPFELTHSTVRFGRKLKAEPEPWDLSDVVFGRKHHPAEYEPVPEPEPEEEDEDDEFYAGKAPIPYAPFEEHFFDDEPDETPAPVQEDAEDDLPWFMR